MNYAKTRSAQVAIGERRKPRPEGKPGYLRVDTAHQGDLDGRQVAGAVAAISQKHLEPVLRAILSQFPFPVRGFHSDIGSEFINDSASGLLRRLLIEQAKSRSRKHMGFGHIAAEHAEDIGRFYRRYFNPYLNFHRPCGQPERMVDERGKEK